MCRPLSRNVPTTTNSKSCSDKSSQPQLNRFAIGSKQQTNLNPNSVPANKNLLQCKSEKLDGKSTSVCNSKKNHVINPPVVRMDRVVQSSATVKKGNLNSNSVSVSPSAIPADKRELPSPQQPPPQTSQNLSPQSPYLSHSPITIFSNQSLMSPINSSGHQTLANTSATVNKKAAATTTTNAAANSTNTTEKKPGKSKKVPKERKLLPCKDRVYDPDKHCGVIVANTGKHCTRSLTCKTHSLAMRRNVPGRRKRFDELLSDHRANKEAMGKAAKAAAATTASSNTTVSNSRATTNSNLNDSNKTNTQSSTNATLSVTNSTNSLNKGLQQAKLNCGNSSSGTSGSANISSVNERLMINRNSTKSKLSNAKNHVQSSPVHSRPSSASVGQSNSTEAQRKSSDWSATTTSTVQSALTSLSSSSSSSSSSSTVDKDDDGYITHHPKPAAVCTFNSRQMGLGIYVHDRKLDSIRAVLRLALGERISQPQSVKFRKLCVESRLPPVPESSDPSDPYCFTIGEQTNSFTPSVAASSASLTVPVTSCGKSLPTSSTNLKSPPLLSQSFSSIKSSSQKVGSKLCSNRPVKNKSKDIANDSFVRKSTNSEQVNKSVRISNSGGSSLKRKRDSTDLCSGSDATNNSPPYTTSSAGAFGSGLNSNVNLSSGNSSNVLSVPFPIGLNAAQLTTGNIPHLNKTNSVSAPFVIPACINRNHSAVNVAATNTLKDVNLVVTNVEVVNGQLGHAVPASSTIISRSTNPNVISVMANTTGNVRTHLSGINLGLTAAGSTLTLAAAGSLSSVPNRASSLIVSSSSSNSPSSSSASSQIFSITSSNSASSSVITKETKNLNSKRAKSSSATKSVRHAGSPNTSTVMTPTKWSMANSTAVLTGLGALSNANLLSSSSSLTTNNHVGITNLDNSGISPPHSTFTSQINIKSSTSSHLSSSSPLINGLGSSSSLNAASSSTSSSLHHRNLTNHILPANTATFTVNSDSQIGISSDGPTLNSKTVQSKGRGSRPNTCRNSLNTSSKQQQQVSVTSSNSSNLIGLGQTISLTTSGSNGGNLTKLLPSSESDCSNVSVSSGAIQESSTNNSSSTSQLSHLTTIPLKLLSSAGLGATSVNSAKSKSQKTFAGLEFKRPSEMQGSSTLPT
ncbi:Ataxin 7-like, variant 2 [Chamberlinius hualienensis]